MRILVTDAHNNTGLAIVRSLGREGHRVLGAAPAGLPFGLHSRYSEPYRIYPDPEREGFRETFLELVRDSRPHALLASSTAIVRTLAQHAERFEKHCAFLLPQSESVERAQDSQLCHHDCRELGVACPASLSRDEARAELASGRAEQIVVKPRRDVGAARGVCFARSPGELDAAAAQCAAHWGEPMFQEFIPGEPSAMRTAIVLYDREHRLYTWFTAQKLRAHPRAGGMTALSVSTDEYRALVHPVRPLFERWSWRGPAEIEWKIDGRDGRAKLIEVNPRLPAYVGFAIACGVRFPELIARLAVGERLPPRRRYQVGRRYLNPMLHLRSAAEELRASPRPALALELLREQLGPCVRASRDFTDPSPRVGRWLAELGRWTRLR
jgi:predicted ATP-grasp superfamily ATP-dependent carboligase